MFSVSSPPLALKGQVKLTTNFLLIIIILFTLYTTSCEARHLRDVNGAKCSSNKSSSPSEDSTPEVGVTARKQMRASLMVHGSEKKTRAGSSTANGSMGAEAAASIIPSGGTRNGMHNGDQGIHVDYAVPKTRTPYHN